MRRYAWFWFPAAFSPLVIVPEQPQFTGALGAALLLGK